MPDKQIVLWFEDEARFGQQGTLTRVWAERGSRPRAFRQNERESLYLCASVCPTTGERHCCVVPWLNSDVMEAYLNDFASHLDENVHAIMVLDGAGWHSSPKLNVPKNITLLSLPPNSPELNPAELPWREMRQKYLGNQIFATIEELDRAIVNAWMEVTKNNVKLAELCNFDWIDNIGKC